MIDFVHAFVIINVHLLNVLRLRLSLNE